MGLTKSIWLRPAEYLAANHPENPVMFFAPATLQAAAQQFIAGFPGLVTYAVKSNPDPAVIENLLTAGIHGFDVASPAEMRLIRQLMPGAALHYNNPVRSPAEIAVGVELGVTSWSVDSHSELAKLRAQVPPKGAEIAVRFKLPVAGAAYDFGAKFGAPREVAVDLLRQAAATGYRPALTFHPGTQCTDPTTWATYIAAAGEIAATAGVRIARLNVGGGFPSHRRNGALPDLAAIFATIARTTATVFGPNAPELVCEPGRAMVAEAFTLGARVKAVRDGDHVFLNDGTYGTLDELPMIGLIDRAEVLAPDGQPRHGVMRPRVVFGPTCDSVDRLPDMLALPDDIAEGDYLLLHGMGAYSLATNTRFNGFGEVEVITVLGLH